VHVFNDIESTLTECFYGYGITRRGHGACQGAFPESELRQLFAANADGTVGSCKASAQTIHQAIGAGQKQRDYSNIRVPVSAFFEFIRPASAPPRPDEYQPQSEEERAAIAACRRATAACVESWMDTSRRECLPRVSLTCQERATSCFSPGKRQC
jgi:hypothetical protein